jgi:hypothetical protein
MWPLRVGGAAAFILVTAAVVLAVPDQFDLAVNTAAYIPRDVQYPQFSWASQNARASSGFCLSESQGRVVTNLSRPLYTRPVTIAYIRQSAQPLRQTPDAAAQHACNGPAEILQVQKRQLTRVVLCGVRSMRSVFAACPDGSDACS